jgi:hypothetical protein
MTRKEKTRILALIRFIIGRHPSFYNYYKTCSTVKWLGVTPAQKAEIEYDLGDHPELAFKDAPHGGLIVWFPKEGIGHDLEKAKAFWLTRAVGDFADEEDYRPSRNAGMNIAASRIW